MNYTSGTMQDADAIDAFLDGSWAEQGLAHATLQAYRSDLEHFSNWLDKQDIDLIVADHQAIQITWCRGFKRAREQAAWLACCRRYGCFIGMRNAKPGAQTILART